MTGSALVTDGEYKHTLAIVRSLGRRGMEIACTSKVRNAISFRSKYCSRPVILPGHDPTDLLQCLLTELEEQDHDILLPVGSASTCLVSTHRRELGKHTRVPVEELGKMRFAGDKGKVMELAEELGIPTPRTARISSEAEILEFAGEFGFPVVVKSAVELSTRRVVHVRSENDMENCLPDDRYRQPNVEFLVQEYIGGHGHGYFVLAKDGRPLAEFCHRRIHEYPPTGGPSTMCESIVSEEMISAGRKLIGALEWTGVAMVEFRGTPGNDLRVLEINPKFWGSLDLAIAAGVDFPYLTYLMAMGEEFAQPSPCRGVKYRWVQHDLRYALDTGSLMGYLLDFLRPNVRDDLNLDDCRPTLVTARGMISEMGRFLIAGRRGDYPN